MYLVEFKAKEGDSNGCINQIEANAKWKLLREECPIDRNIFVCDKENPVFMSVLTFHKRLTNHTMKRRKFK